VEVRQLEAEAIVDKPALEPELELLALLRTDIGVTRCRWPHADSKGAWGDEVRRGIERRTCTAVRLTAAHAVRAAQLELRDGSTRQEVRQAVEVVFVRDDVRETN